VLNNQILALSKIIFLSGFRKHAVWALCVFAVLFEVTGIFFIDFFGRDLGRIVVDFLFTIMWSAGMLFVLFYVIQTVSWDDESRMIDSILAKPVSRVQYTLGVILGLSVTLLMFESIMFVSAYLEIQWLYNSMDRSYFPYFSTINFIYSWISLQVILLSILSVAVFVSGVIRGAFPVMLMTLSYFFICSGIPVVRVSIEQKITDGENLNELLEVIKSLQMLFPDFSILDFKSSVLNSNSIFITSNVIDLFSFIMYIVFVVAATCVVYKNKDIT